MTMEQPPITVLVVNWNCGEFLVRCIQSVLRSQPKDPCSILVVDNASTDASVDLLLERMAEAPTGRASLHVLRNPENVGFARAVNQGIRATDSPLVLVLNPDTEVRPGAIDSLAAALAGNPRAGVCAPRLLHSDGSLQVSVWPNPPTPAYILLEGLRISRLLPKRLRAHYLLGKHWDHAAQREVPSFSGAAFMLRRALMEQVGGLDERFEFYGEDAELWFRISRSGWRLLFEPAAEVVHIGSHSARQRWSADERRLREVAAHIAFQQRCLSPALVLANALANLVVLGLTAVWQELRFRDNSLTWSVWWKQACAALWAARHLGSHPFTEPPTAPIALGPQR
jgi:GT2 family glycosyltransferase